MSDENPDDLAEVVRQALYNHMGDILRTKYFARNMANTIQTIFMKAPAGSEIEADLQALREYAVGSLNIFTIAEDVLKGLVTMAETPKPIENEIVDESSVKAMVH